MGAKSKHKIILWAVEFELGLWKVPGAKFWSSESFLGAWRRVLIVLTGVGAATEHPGAQLAWSELVDQTGRWTLGSPALRRLAGGEGLGAG